MDRLLAVNEGMAVYYHDESTPAKRVDPFKYLNELLSIRSAKGLVSFLQQYPDELVVMHEATAFKSGKDAGYVVGNYAHRRLKTARPKRGLLYGNGEQWKPLPKKESEQAEEDDDVPADPEHGSEERRRMPMFSFGEAALMNAASEYNVDYFDALTDLEKYTHYGESIEAWLKTLPVPKETWTAEETKQYYEAEYTRPKPELRIVFFEELELLVLRVSALLEMAAVSHGIKDRVSDDEVMFEFEHVNEPMGLCRTVFPERYIADLLPIPQALYALDNLHTDFYSHSVTRLHLEDDGGVSFLAHTNDERLATQDAAGCIVSFVLAEWSHYYNKTDTMSFDVNFGYQLYEQNNNPVVTELCRTRTMRPNSATSLTSCKGVHLLAVDGTTIDHLRTWKDFHAKALKLIDVDPESGDTASGQTEDTPVCCNGAGKWLNPRNLGRWWGTTQEVGYRHSIGFDDLRLHELRHTQATQLIGAGVDFKTVQTPRLCRRVAHHQHLHARHPGERPRGCEPHRQHNWLIFRACRRIRCCKTQKDGLECTNPLRNPPRLRAKRKQARDEALTCEDLVARAGFEPAISALRGKQGCGNRGRLTYTKGRLSRSFAQTYGN